MEVDQAWKFCQRARRAPHQPLRRLSRVVLESEKQRAVARLPDDHLNAIASFR
jgi:hypothetical protein